jgi:hypothetical protein
MTKNIVVPSAYCRSERLLSFRAPIVIPSAAKNLFESTVNHGDTLVSGLRAKPETGIT